MDRKWINFRIGSWPAWCFLLTTVLGGSAALLYSQMFSQQSPRLSQHGSVSQQIADTRVTIEYNRPVARGRELFGDLVPWGRIWNPGANEATSITLSTSTKPALLLLDEPLEGLAPIIVEELTGLIRRMVADGSIAVILAEQHAEIALSLTRDVVVLERGAIVHRALSADMLKDAAALDQFIGLQIAVKK